jgi:hypothetical protein
LPQWKLRRLICEDGKWHCSFSKQLGVPAGLDEVAEADHESLPLAILSALVEALSRDNLDENDSGNQSVKRRPVAKV